MASVFASGRYVRAILHRGCKGLEAVTDDGANFSESFWRAASATLDHDDCREGSIQMMKLMLFAPKGLANESMQMIDLARLCG